jgi:hypothetical protein
MKQQTTAHGLTVLGSNYPLDCMAIRGFFIGYISMSLFIKPQMMSIAKNVNTPNPAFHPTGNSGLLPLLQSGEFER